MYKVKLCENKEKNLLSIHVYFFWKSNDFGWISINCDRDQTIRKPIRPLTLLLSSWFKRGFLGCAFFLATGEPRYTTSSCKEWSSRWGDKIFTLSLGSWAINEQNTWPSGFNPSGFERNEFLQISVKVSPYIQDSATSRGSSLPF